MEEDFLPRAARRKSSLEEKKICYPSHKPAFVCLPGPSKPLTRLGKRTMAAVPLLPPSVFLLFAPAVFPPILFELICQHNADIQRFVCTSSPRGTSAQTPPLVRFSAQKKVARAHTHACSQPALMLSVCRTNREKRSKNKSTEGYINTIPCCWEKKQLKTACIGSEMCAAPINAVAQGT